MKIFFFRFFILFFLRLCLDLIEHASNLPNNNSGSRTTTYWLKPVTVSCIFRISLFNENDHFSLQWPKLFLPSLVSTDCYVQNFETHDHILCFKIQNTSGRSITYNLHNRVSQNVEPSPGTFSTLNLLPASAWLQRMVNSSGSAYCTAENIDLLMT